MRGPFTHPVASARTPSRRWHAALPTASLVVVTVLVGAIAIGGTLPSRDLVRLPAPVTGFGITGDTVLMQSRIDALPLGTQWSSILRVTLAPGVVWELGRKLYDDDGPMLYRVTSGALTIQAEQPISVTLAGTPDAQTLMPHTEAVLHPGDHGFTPAGVLSRWRNDGHEPVEVLQVKLSLVGFDGSCIPPPPGVSIAPLIEQRKWEQPVHPIVVTLHQVTLDARAVVPVEAVPGLELLYVVSGHLSVHDPPQADEPSSLLVPTLDGTGRPIDKGAVGKGTIRPGRVLRSGANDAAVLLLLTMIPAEPAAEPTVAALPAQHPSSQSHVLAPVPLSYGAQGGALLKPRPVILREGAAACGVHDGR
ncbi:MAG: hypothetical protein K0Q71_2926 [Thermomicrobiales bacterium]|nr:hypothetical protein [Thermomicrobiales bacterium]